MPRSAATVRGLDGSSAAAQDPAVIATVTIALDARLRTPELSSTTTTGLGRNRFIALVFDGEV